MAEKEMPNRQEIESWTPAEWQQWMGNKEITPLNDKFSGKMISVPVSLLQSLCEFIEGIRDDADRAQNSAEDAVAGATYAIDSGHDAKDMAQEAAYELNSVSLKAENVNKTIMEIVHASTSVPQTQ